MILQELEKRERDAWNRKNAYDKTYAMLEYTRSVVLFMIDCTQGITHRDLTLLEEVSRLGLPMIFCLNKADLVKPEAINAMVKGAQSYLDFESTSLLCQSQHSMEMVSKSFKMVAILQTENQK